MIYGQRPSEYYFNFLLPTIILILACILSIILKRSKLLGFSFILAVVVFFSREAVSLLSDNPLSLFYKDRAVRFIREIGKSKEFNISFSVPRGFDTGYRYLIDFYKIKQSGNMKDPLYKIVVLPAGESVTKTFGKIGVYFPEDP